MKIECYNNSDKNVTEEVIWDCISCYFQCKITMRVIDPVCSVVDIPEEGMGIRFNKYSCMSFEEMKPLMCNLSKDWTRYEVAKVLFDSNDMNQMKELEKIIDDIKAL